MHLLKDEVVAISAKREKFFGCSGQMLLPCPDTVASVVNDVPVGTVTTLDILRRELARRAGVEAVCPVTTKHALRAIAAQSTSVPLWRLVKKNGELLAYLPGGSEHQAALLAQEQVATTQTLRGEKVIQKVNGLKSYLLSFEPREA